MPSPRVGSTAALSLCAAVLVLGGLAACAASATAGGPAAAPGANAPDTATRGVALPLVYRREGGIRGLMDRVVVEADGRVLIHEHDTARTTTMRPANLVRLRETLQGIPTAAWIVQADAQCCDRITHRIEASGQVLMFTEGAPPAGVRPLMALLSALLPSTTQESLL